MAHTAYKPNLSDSYVEKLKPPAKGDKWYRDSQIPGFSIRVYADGATKKGAKVYGVTLAIDGREKYIRIGPHGEWTAKAARTEAGEIKRNFNAGLDPLAHRNKVTLFTVAALFEAWKESDWVHLAESTKDRYQRLWDRFIPDWFRSKLLSQVKGEDIMKIHKVVAKGGKKGERIGNKNPRKFISKPSPVQANRTVAMLSSMFGNQMEKDQDSRNGLKANPCPPRVKLTSEPKKEIWLTQDQQHRLKTFLEDPANRRPDGHAAWQAATIKAKTINSPDDGSPKQRLSETAMNALLFIFHTGLRHWEALELTWDKVNFERGFLLVPIRKTGAKKPTASKEKKVRLTPPAKALLSALPSLPKKEPWTGWVFPNEQGDGHWENIQDSWEYIRDLTRLPKNTRIHDLRHTLATDLIAAGMDGIEAQAFMGWASRSAADRYSHAVEEVWGPLVDQIASSRGLNPETAKRPRFKFRGIESESLSIN